MGTDVIIEDARWAEAGLAALADKAVAATLGHLGLEPDAWEVAVLGADDARLAELNGAFRGKPQPTNVLSWPSEDLAPDTPGAAPHTPSKGPDGMYALGDMALGYETCARESAEGKTPFALDDHLTHLVIHGTLHLLGYDHETDPDAALMEGIEREILARMGIGDDDEDAAEIDAAWQAIAERLDHGS